MAVEPWELDRHAWESMQGACRCDVRRYLAVLTSDPSDEKWKDALYWVESYGSDLGLPLPATGATASALLSVILTLRSGSRRYDLLSAVEVMIGGAMNVSFEGEVLECSDRALGAILPYIGALEMILEGGTTQERREVCTILTHTALRFTDLRSRVVYYLMKTGDAHPDLVDASVALTKQLT